MKNVIILFGLVLLANVATAGNPDLLDDWELERMELSDIEYIPPNNAEISSVILTIEFEVDIYIFDTYVCGSIDVGCCIGFDNNFIYFDGFPVVYEGNCMLKESIEFRDLYFGFFLDNLKIPYEIFYPSDSVKELVLTNADGDKLFYKSKKLSTPENKALSFKIVPNPSNDLISLIGDTKGINSLNVYSIEGSKLMERGDTKKIDISQLTSGIYFIEVLLNGHRSVQKFIKN